MIFSDFADFSDFLIFLNYIWKALELFTDEILRLEARTLINLISSFFFFVILRKFDSLENRINADIRKVYFDELQKLS
jgi:hypothetical protein